MIQNPNGRNTAKIGIIPQCLRRQENIHHSLAPETCESTSSTTRPGQFLPAWSFQRPHTITPPGRSNRHD